MRDHCYHCGGQAVRSTSYGNFCSAKCLNLYTETDMVNNPPHYTQGEIECIDAIKSALGIEGFKYFCRGQIIKYTWRAEHKNDFNEDIQKCEYYVQRLREVSE